MKKKRIGSYVSEHYGLKSLLIMNRKFLPPYLSSSKITGRGFRVLISRRQGSKDSIIRVSVENSTSSFGMISHESAAAIAALYDGLAGGTIRFQRRILPQPRRTDDFTVI